MTPLKAVNSLAICDICGKQLARQSDMPRHKRLHDPRPDRWMHWCPEPGCEYGSMQRSNLRNHIRKHTGQRLRCPDDSTCNYSTFDKSALLRHRQRKHGYQAKSTASKCRYMKVAENRTASSGGLDNASIDDSSNCPSEPTTSSPSTPSCRANGSIDELNIWQDDDHVPQDQTTVTEKPVELTELETDEYVTSRFPISFARTRLPHTPPINGALSASNHCRRRVCDLRSNLVPAAHSNGTVSDVVPRSRRGAKELVIYRRVSYLVKESLFLATC